MSEENTAQNPDQTTEATNAEQTQEQGTTESTKTFTQSEVNALLADEKRKLKAKYADYDELKTTVTRLDEIKNESFEQGKATATGELVGRLVETEIRSTAQALGFNNPSVALTLFGDKSSVSYDPDTGLDQEAIINRLTELAEQEPYLIKSEKVSGTSITSRPAPKTVVTEDTTEKPIDVATGLRQAFSKKH